MHIGDYETEVMPPILQQWAPHIVDLILKQFPSTYYLSVCGSILTSRFNPGSDIDLLALIDGKELEYNSIQLVCEKCDGRMLEVAVMPFFRLLQNFDLAPHTNNISLLTEAYYSISLMDTKNIRSTIRNQAFQILENGPMRCNQKIINQYRRRLFDAINNAKFNNDNNELKFNIRYLENILLEIILRINNIWLTPRYDHWLYRRALQCQSPLAKDLIKAISKENKDQLFQIAEKVLNEIGGAPQNGFTITII